jgi:hypothetical protein
MLANEVRDNLGRRARDVWVRWASQQDNPKPSWLVSWEQLSESEREVDRQIGESLWMLGIDCAASVCRMEAEEERVYTSGEAGERFAMPKERCAEAIEAYKATGLFTRLGGPYATASRKVQNPLLGIQTG